MLRTVKGGQWVIHLVDIGQPLSNACMLESWSWYCKGRLWIKWTLMSIEFHFVCKHCCNENDQLWNPTGAIPSIFTFCFDFFDFFYLGMVKCWWSTSLRSSFGWLLLVGSHSMVQRHSILSLFIWDVRSKSRESPCSMGISVCLETHRRVSESLSGQSKPMFMPV